VLTDTAVSGNEVVEENIAASALSGAGLGNAGNLILNRSSVTGNFFDHEGPGNGLPHFGAGIVSNSSNSSLTLLNSTVTGNVDTDATSEAGAVTGFQDNTVVRIIHSTIAGNPHSSAAFNLNFPGSVGTTVELRGSVIDDGPNACGVVAGTSSYNVDAGSSCPVGTGGVSNAAPLLGPLASNGGPTQTLALLSGSPAIDRVPLAACTDDLGAPLTHDQRGFARPVGGACDAGAFESVPGPSSGTPAPAPGPGTKKKCKKKKKKSRASTAKKKKCKKKKRR